MGNTHHNYGPFHHSIKTTHVFNENGQVFMRRTRERKGAVQAANEEWLPIQLTWTAV